MSVEPPAFVPPGYTVLRKLGSGQTSHVYLARQRSRGEVALKLPRQDLQSQPVLRRMFENEVQITQALKNPHVVQALEGYPTGPQAFLALEYCSGGTLDQLLLEQGRLGLERAAQLILDVAQGLWHSHQRQVLHRDVKPANVFLTGDGRAKLGDFGTGIFLTDNKRLEERVGTAFYMAPELFEGKPSNISSDIYSLGVLAYEVLAGERPFQGESYEELMLQHLTSLPRNLRNLRKDVPGALNHIVVKAMSRDASKRYDNVGEFVQAFAKASGSDPLEPRQTASETGRGSRNPTLERPVTKTASREPEAHKRGLFGWLRGRKK